MADKTQSDSDAARIKRGTLPVKIKRKQPFVLESFLSHADGGRTIANYRKNEAIFRQGDSADAVFYIMLKSRTEGISALDYARAMTSRSCSRSALDELQGPVWVEEDRFPCWREP